VKDNRNERGISLPATQFMLVFDPKVGIVDMLPLCTNVSPAQKVTTRLEKAILNSSVKVLGNLALKAIPVIASLASKRSKLMSSRGRMVVLRETLISIAMQGATRWTFVAR
jgi:hypothetical protein